MRVLLITYNWPPKNTVGSLRPYYWAKKLSDIEGVSVDVLTSKKYSFDAPLNLNLPTLPNVDLFEIAYGGTKTAIGSILKRSLPPSIRELVKKIVSPKQKKTANVRWGWCQESRRFLLENGHKYDCVISTYGPDMCHYLGSFLKDRNNDVFWVADYRDLWSLNHLEYDSEKSRGDDREKEKDLVWSKADLITTVSDGLVKQLNDAGVKNAVKITNGHDVTRTDLTSLISSSNNRVKNTQSWRILHAGSIYPGFREPGPFLSALDRLIQKGILKKQIQVEFIGKNLHHIKFYENQYEFVKVTGEVSREQSIEMQRSADFLLLLESPLPEAEGVLTGKVFEYITSGVPVLGAGLRDDSELGVLLKKTKTGFVLGSDENTIESRLRAIIENQSDFKFDPSVDEVMKYSQSEIVLDLYESIISRRRCESKA
jgi:glycosyltransferase involved in cell wall biosynthesis